MSFGSYLPRPGSALCHPTCSHVECALHPKSLRCGVERKRGQSHLAIQSEPKHSLLSTDCPGSSPREASTAAASQGSPVVPWKDSEASEDEPRPCFPHLPISTSRAPGRGCGEPLSIWDLVWVCRKDGAPDEIGVGTTSGRK